MFHLECDCGSKLNIPETVIGKKAACKRCRCSVRLLAVEPGEEEDFASRLTIQSGPQREGEIIYLGGTGAIDIGTLAERRLRLVGQSVSRKHGRLDPGPDGWILHDNNSTNGLFVNDRRITERRLRDGDIVRIGEYELLFQSTAPQAGWHGQAESAELARAERPAMPNTTGEDDADPLYALAEDDTDPPLALAEEDDGPDWLGDALSQSAASEQRAAAQERAAAADAARMVVCPSCDKPLAPAAQVCITCGIQIKSGRPIITAQAVDENELHYKAGEAIRWISWLIPIGLYPLASEGFGTRKPYVTWAIFAATLLASVLFFISSWTSDTPFPPGSQYMLWYGDPDAQPVSMRDLAITAAVADTDYRFQPHQLITHAFLHGGILHLAGNMLFLLVFGTRVNSLIGNIATALLYPILAVAAAAAHMYSIRNGVPGPMLGASGAIMGLAGMYFILFPVHKIYMSAWIRFGLFTGFKLFLKIWSLRGFWVVLFFIAFDVIATILGSQDGVAHWAHLGGFIVGMTIALIMLLTRMVNARGGDLLSATLGRYAWPLIGKPSRWNQPAPG